MVTVMKMELWCDMLMVMVIIMVMVMVITMVMVMVMQMNICDVMWHVDGDAVADGDVMWFVVVDGDVDGYVMWCDVMWCDMLMLMLIVIVMWCDVMWYVDVDVGGDEYVICDILMMEMRYDIWYDVMW